MVKKDSILPHNMRDLPEEEVICVDYEVGPFVNFDLSCNGPERYRITVLVQE